MCIRDRKHSISDEADGRAVLLVGDSDWPFPAPLVRQEGGWAFDAEAGREEITNRRIGRNELDTVQTLLAVSYTHLDVYKRQVFTYVDDLLLLLKRVGRRLQRANR